jgi:signal transduction histidine kinase
MTLRARLALTFFLTVLVTGAAVAWFGATLATRYVEEGEEALAIRASESARVERNRRERSTARIVHGLSDMVDPDLPLVLHVADLAGLDILQVLDENGVVRASLHWPEQVGSRSAPETDPGCDTGCELMVPGAENERAAFVVRAPLSYQGRSGVLIGGFYLKGDTEPPPAFSNRPAGLGLTRPLLLAGLVFAVFAGLVGMLLATALTRPLCEMTRALDAVAAGNENHDYPKPRGDEFGPLVSSLSRMRSVLDREQARRKAVERVAAWREAARRVAHEVKNPLVPIRLTMENMIKARCKGKEQFDPIFEEGAPAVLEEVGRLGKIVDAFSAYARMPSPEIRKADLDRILDPVVALFAGEPDLEVRRERGPAVMTVDADPDLLAQAFRNILSNCREALGNEGGEIRVRTWGEEPYGVVEISDTGPGLPDDVLERLFDPYFTTRTEGTGLGMAITYRIVTEHGGTITAGNLPGGGARFTVTLPLSGSEK